MSGFFYYKESSMTQEIEELQESINRVKELKRIIDRLQSAIICEKDELEDLIELARTYANYSIDDLERSYLHVWDKHRHENVVQFPLRVHTDEDA
tara:strand:- start:374 stop:658 length:285 start_codon:yes stop_codon:yes gene_type:complete